jgi:hypothetical protein
MVTIPLREFEVGFALVVVTLTEPSLEAFAGNTFSHDTLALAVQLTFEEIVIWPLLFDSDSNIKLVGVTDSVGVGAL